MVKREFYVGFEVCQKVKSRPLKPFLSFTLGFRNTAHFLVTADLIAIVAPEADLDCGVRNKPFRAHCDTMPLGASGGRGSYANFGSALAQRAWRERAPPKYGLARFMPIPLR